MSMLTLCMIVRDEQEMLPDCLASVEKVVDRMIIVDTGSRDGTRDVIRRFGAECVEYEWNDDFAAARNAGLDLVEGGYVLVLDADERLTTQGASVLRAAVNRGRLDLGMLPLHDAMSVSASPADVLGGLARRGEPMPLPRLMRWTPDLRFEGIVHESVSAWASEPGRQIVHLDTPIIHYGAAAELREERGKSERNLRLLERRCQLEPDNPTPRAYLAAELRQAEKPREALESAREAWTVWRRCKARGERHDAVLPAGLLAHLALDFDHFDEALDGAHEALESEDHPNLHLLAGLASERRVLRQGAGADRLGEAARHYERCLELAGKTFVSEVMAGATSWQAAVRLGTVRLQRGDAKGAARSFESALAAREDLVEARLGLADAKRALGDADTALAMLEPLLVADNPDAWLVSAQAALDLGSASDSADLCKRARAARDTQNFVAPHRDRTMTALERELKQLTYSPKKPESNPDPTCVFAWPCYAESEDLDSLMGEFGTLLADRPGLVLCLRFDAAVDGDYAQAQAGLSRAFAKHMGDDRALEVVLLDQDLSDPLGASTLAGPGDIALALPHTRGVRAHFLDQLGARRVDSPEALSLALGDDGSGTPDRSSASAPIIDHGAPDAKTEIIQTEVAGKVVRFTYPAALGLKPFVESVLNGNDYPLVFPGLFEARTIVDIGAHAGAATVYLKGHYPNARVFAFEPSQLAHTHLLANLSELSDVTPYKVALSDHDGEANLYAGFYSSMQCSIKPNEENDETYETVPLANAGKVFEDLGQEVLSIVKIDTEGCEVEILDAISRFLPIIEVIYLEYHSEEDRLEIERRLCPQFVLYASRADEPHRGTNSYVRADVFAEYAARQSQRYVFPKD